MRLTRTFTVLTCLLFSIGAHAAIWQHNFTGTGDNGETATGWVTWNDQSTPNGSILANCGFGPCTFDKSLAWEVTISGGNVAGGTTTFGKSDCRQPAGAGFLNTPNFTIDINFFDCDNGANTMNGFSPNVAFLNGQSSIITWRPGTTVFASNPIPSSSSLGLSLMVLIMVLVAVPWVRARA